MGCSLICQVECVLLVCVCVCAIAHTPLGHGAAQLVPPPTIGVSVLLAAADAAGALAAASSVTLSLLSRPVRLSHDRGTRHATLTDLGSARSQGCEPRL